MASAKVRALLSCSSMNAHTDASIHVWSHILIELHRIHDAAFARVIQEDTYMHQLPLSSRTSAIPCFHPDLYLSSFLFSLCLITFYSCIAVPTSTLHHLLLSYPCTCWKFTYHAPLSHSACCFHHFLQGPIIKWAPGESKAHIIVDAVIPKSHIIIVADRKLLLLFEHHMNQEHIYVIGHASSKIWSYCNKAIQVLTIGRNKQSVIVVFTVMCYNNGILHLPFSCQQRMPCNHPTSCYRER